MSDFIEVISPKALSELQAVNAEIVKTIAGVKDVNANMISIKTPSGSDSAIKKLTAAYKEQEVAIKKLQLQIEKLINNKKKEEDATAKFMRQLENETKARQSLSKQKEKAIADIEKENIAIAKAENIYNKIQAKVNGMIPAYNNLQAKQKIGLTLTAKEEAQLKLLENRLNKYQNVLKETDITIGKHGREVGNYAKGTSNLQMAIGQISRELPNFGQSLQIGIMSLTNNVGALIDGVKQVKLQNAELKKQGIETKSAMSQVLTSLLSWQTALFVGIGLLNAYGKELGDWVSALWDGDSALKELAKNQKAFNEAKFQGQKDAQSEILDVKKYLAVVKDRNISDEERNIALKQLRSQYPFYFKDLTDEQILLGKSEKAVASLMTALEKRKEIEKKSEISTTNKQKLLDLEKELDKVKELEKATIKQLDIERAKPRINDRATAQAQRTKELKLEEGLNSSKEKQISLNNQIAKYNEDLIKTETDIFNLKKETIALEFQPEKEKELKQKKEKIALNFSEIESEYNLKLAILERQRAERADRMNNQDLDFETRLKAREEYSAKSIEILDMQVKKEKDLLKEQYLDDLDKNNLAYKNKELTAEQWSANIVAIQNRLSNELKTVDMKYSLEWNDLLNENAKFYRDFQDKNREYTEQTNKIILESEKQRYDKTVNDTKNTLTIRQKAFEKLIELSKKELEVQKIKDLANAKSNEEVILITQTYIDAIAKLDGLVSPLQKAREETDAFIGRLASGQIESSLNAIGISSLKMFLDFDKNGETTFDKLLEGADTVAERFAITFQAVGDVAQGVFNAMTEMSNQHFENQRNNLEQDYQIALAFAGDSVSAREEVERQYEARQRAIRRREFQAKKQMALFNIAIDTAQGIVAALAIPNVPLSVAIGVIGAIQAGTVLAQQVPQFWMGTDNAPEGWAITQEKGREIITDKNGNIKSKGSDKGAQLTYLNKGDKVLNNEKTMDYLMFNNDLNNILTNNSIGQPIVEVRNDVNFDKVGKEIVKAINDKPVHGQTISDGELVNYLETKSQRIEIMNKRVNFIPKNV